MSTSKKTNVVLKWLHYLILFILIVANINMIRAVLEITPVYITALSTRVEGEIERAYIESRTRTGGTTSSTSYYLEAKYYINGTEYRNHDGTDEQGYTQLKSGKAINMILLKGFPSIGLIQENKKAVLRTNEIGISAVLLLDIIYSIFYIRYKRRKRKQNE